MKKRGICLFTATTIAVASGCSLASYDNSNINTAEGVNVVYNGEKIEFDTAPVNVDGTILVPMRAVFEALGAKVKWDSETQSVEAKKKSKTYNMTLGETIITESKNDEVKNSVTAEQPLLLINERTMIPIRALGELFGFEVVWDDETETVTLIDNETEDETWKDNIGSIDLSSLEVSGSGVDVDNNIITITSGGDFSVFGKCDDGQIVIDTDEKVNLKLSGMSLKNTTGAAIYIKNADKCYISLESDTENILSDGGEYDENLEVNACVFSEDDLEIKGDGVLTINGNVHHGVSAKDSLEIEEVTLNINSVGDGIHVNDTAEIFSGKINITSSADGIQSEEILEITGGSLNIECNGEVTVDTSSDLLGDNSNEGSEEYEDISSKGIKAGWLMDILGGSINITSNDICIKCDSELNIEGADLTLYSEYKKGIKGMEDVNIYSGKIDIIKSTEGIESKRILTINGGDINIVSTDDGLNAGGDGTTNGGRQGMLNQREKEGMAPPEIPNGEGGMTPPEMPNGEGGMTRPERPQGGAIISGSSTEVSTEHHIGINGGNIYIIAGGDGIDSNGSLVINGGYIVIENNSHGGDTALDCDGLMQLNGGTVIALGPSGMIQLPSSSSQQNVLSVYFTSELQAGSVITIKDSNGNEIINYNTKEAASNLIFSSNDISVGATYTVYVDGTEQGSAEITSVITEIGERMSGGNMGGGRGGRGIYDKNQ